MTWRLHWEKGLTIDEFIASLTTRKAEYEAAIASFEPGVKAVEAVKSWQAGYKVGIITEEWCGDAANYVPPFLKLFTLAPQLEARIFRRDENPELRDANLMGGKAKIPVVVVFDADFNEVARFIERPPAVNRWLAAKLGGRRWNELTPEERAQWKPIFLAKGSEFRSEAVNKLVNAVAGALANSA
jgi:hypothetical protein